MAETNGILEKTGIVQAVSSSKIGDKDKYGIKLEDAWYDGFGKTTVQKGERVTLRYRDKGKYHNVVDGGVLILEATAKTPQPTETGQSGMADFKGGQDIDDLTDIVDNAAGLWGRCFEAIDKAIGHKPATDGELASVNSLFIEANKRLAKHSTF